MLEPFFVRSRPCCIDSACIRSVHSCYCCLIWSCIHFMHMYAIQIYTAFVLKHPSFMVVCCIDIWRWWSVLVLFASEWSTLLKIAAYWKWLLSIYFWKLQLKSREQHKHFLWNKIMGEICNEERSVSYEIAITDWVKHILSEKRITTTSIHFESLSCLLLVLVCTGTSQVISGKYVPCWLLLVFPSAELEYLCLKLLKKTNPWW